MPGVKTPGYRHWVATRPKKPTPVSLHPPHCVPATNRHPRRKRIARLTAKPWRTLRKCPPHEARPPETTGEGSEDRKTGKVCGDVIPSRRRTGIKGHLPITRRVS